ncbi:MAG: hypothetical protein NVSMB9_29340 [Isosphaeraceae bacterium]
MQPSPLIPLAIAGVAFTLLALFWAGNLVLSRRASARIAALFGKGASPAEVARQLAAEGFDLKHAAKLVLKTLRRAEVARASALLEAGASEKDAQGGLMATGADAKVAQDLVAEAVLRRWLRRHPILFGVAGLALFTLGVAVIFGGLILRDGNLSGRFVTFPFAGGLTIMAGTFIVVFGSLPLYFLLKRVG